MKIRQISWALAPALTLCLCACTTSIPRRPPAESFGELGSASELVFTGPDLLAAIPVGVGAESIRRDDALGVRYGQDTVSQILFPPDPAPSLDDIRRFYLADAIAHGGVVYYYRGSRPRYDSPGSTSPRWR